MRWAAPRGFGWLRAPQTPDRISSRRRRASRDSGTWTLVIRREQSVDASTQLVRPTDQRFTRETHSGAPRRSGAPVAAMHAVLTLSVCKRRDAVRLGRVEAARAPGAVFGVLSGATSR